MLRVRIPYSVFCARYPQSINPYVDMLSEWEAWISNLGLQYRKSGSAIDFLLPGQWCIKSYDPKARVGIWAHRDVCFHEDDRAVALLFKLTWG